MLRPFGKIGHGTYEGLKEGYSGWSVQHIRTAGVSKGHAIHGHVQDFRLSLRELITKSSLSGKAVIRFACLKGPLTALWTMDWQRTRLDDDRELWGYCGCSDER